MEFCYRRRQQIEVPRRGEDFKLPLLSVPIITVPNSRIRTAPAHRRIESQNEVNRPS
jgi:hypothetical protein